SPACVHARGDKTDSNTRNNRHGLEQHKRNIWECYGCRQTTGVPLSIVYKGGCQRLLRLMENGHGHAEAHHAHRKHSESNILRPGVARTARGIRRGHEFSVLNRDKTFTNSSGTLKTLRASVGLRLVSLTKPGKRLTCSLCSLRSNIRYSGGSCTKYLLTA